MQSNSPFSRFSEYFVATAKTGSFRKAADSLFISVSAIHRQIALAEENFGISLFERLPNGLKLTTAGELLYYDILRWQKDFKQTQQRFDEIQGLRRGNVNFSLISALNDSFVINALGDIHQQYPWINFNIHMHDSKHIVKQLTDNEIDFGLILDPQQHAQMEVVAFIEVPIGLVCAVTHPLAQEKTLTLSKTLDVRHIIADAPLMINERAMAIYKRHQFNPAQSTQCNDIRMIVSMIKQQFGCAILSYLDVHTEVQQGQLKFITFTEKGIQPLTLALCIAPKRQVSKAAQMMMHRLIIKIEELKQALEYFQ